MVLISTALEAQDKKFYYNGDFRIRGEGNYGGTLHPWYREVVRFRLRTRYQVNPMFSVNTGLGTGSKGDPNTNDVTLGNFNDKLELNLFTANVGFNYKAITIQGGKFEMPFNQTDMVWDSDIYPQGVSFRYGSLNSNVIIPFVSALFFVIDDQTVLKDSYMSGLQAGFDFKINKKSLSLSMAYYDYTIGSFKNTDPLTNVTGGDIRTNFLNEDSTGYRNKFKLADAILRMNFNAGNLPAGFILNFVYNTGASSDNKGFSADVFVGKTSKVKDFKLLYGLSMTETDAVLAAFSNDNTQQPTNYFQHTVAIDYVILDNTTLDFTYYLYRKLNSFDEPNPYLSRLRLNLALKF